MNRIIIEEEDWIDRDWGDIASCAAVPFSDEWPYDKGTCVPNRNPWEAMCDFDVTYKNGRKVRLSARGRELLCGNGFRGAILEEGEWKSPEEIVGNSAYSSTGHRFFNPRLVATVAEALSKCVPIPQGEVKLVDADSAEGILSENGIPAFPSLEDEKVEGDLYGRWCKKWIDEGVCVNDDGGHGRCVSKMLLEEERRRMAESKTEQRDLFAPHG